MKGWAWVAVAALGAATVVAIVLAGREEAPPAPVVFISRPATPVADSERFEIVQSAISKRINKAFRTGIRRGDDGPIAAILTADFLAMMPKARAGAPVDDDDLRVVTVPCEDLTPIGPESFLKRLRGITEAMAEVERVSLRAYEFLLDPSETRATARYHGHLAGRGTDRRAIELHADAEVEVVKTDGNWRLRRFAMLGLRRIESDRSPFVERTDETGFEFAYSAEGRRLIEAEIDNGVNRGAVAGGLSVMDWNHDGFPDVIATHGERRSILFVNDGRGGFQPRPLPGSGSYFFLVLDLDNDGREELVTTHPGRTRNGKASLGLYTREQERWVAKPGVLTFENPARRRQLRYPHITAGDVNRDGLPDLYVCGYRSSESRHRQNHSYTDAADGLPNLLFINHGGLRFTEVAAAQGVAGSRWSFVSEFFDIDGDRDADLVVVNDFGPNNVYLNRGDGSFVEEPDHALARGTTFGMGLAIADYDNRGTFSYYVSYMHSHAGLRMLPLAPKLDAEVRSDLIFSARGNALYDRRDGRWTERAVERGVDNAGWAWGCIFFDADNDADKDLYVVNGYTSHSDPEASDY